MKEEYFSRTKEYTNAKSKLDCFLNRVTRVYMTKRRPFINLMDLQASMIQWVDGLDPTLKTAMKNHSTFLFLQTLFRPEIIDYLTKNING